MNECFHWDYCFFTCAHYTQMKMTKNGEMRIIVPVEWVIIHTCVYALWFYCTTPFIPSLFTEFEMYLAFASLFDKSVCNFIINNFSPEVSIWYRRKIAKQNTTNIWKQCRFLCLFFCFCFLFCCIRGPLNCQMA